MELRREKKWTQEVLAERLHVDAREIRRLEAGGNTTVHVLVSLARIFAIEIPKLFDLPDKKIVRKPGRPKKTTSA